VDVHLGERLSCHSSFWNLGPLLVKDRTFMLGLRTIPTGKIYLNFVLDCFEAAIVS
jgi:hypothetical protein